MVALLINKLLIAELGSNRWMDKEIVIHPDNGIFFSAKKKWAKKKKDMEESEMRITKWMKPIWTVYVLYDSNYVAFWERQNYSKKISGCQGLKER